MLVAKKMGDWWGDKFGNIDVAAQKAIVRLSRNASTAADAHALLDAVQNRELRGIFIETVRAQQLGTSYEKLIPAGEDAEVVVGLTGSGQPPLIAFRDSVKTNPVRLDAALVKASHSFHLWQRGQVGPCTGPRNSPVGNVFARILPSQA